ncbi:MAG: hypothetical protein CL532_00070 [Aestuariivita sp.]|nr:hypothetical protein [Aestuariivita sp.]|tara:strand:- start:216 stop:650 length:435 start_codon:yes stop_codon:yes gene_type:complete
MAKVYTGRDGVLQVAGTTIAKVSSFSVQANLETLETTTLSENIRSYVPGVVGYTGSCSLLYYKEDSGSINTTSLLSALVKTGSAGVTSSDTVDLTFRWVDGADINDIKIKAYVSSATMGAATADLVRAEISFIGTGELLAATIS